MAPRAAVDKPRSPVTAAANAFVEAHRAQAKELGREIADLVNEPEAFVATLRAGMAHLVDKNYRREQSRVAPGLEDSVGIRLPLLSEIRRAFDRNSKWAGPDSLLWLSDRLLREQGLEIRVLAFETLTRVLPRDPERGWQILRRAAREAHEWITVDTLAHTYGAGILLEPFRWAEIEQLAYSAAPWERRLVGSTIATIPFVNRREGRQPEIAARALPIVGNLIGDSDADVQKSLSWALRSMAHVDLAALTAFAEAQSLRARATDDGHRAWVIRDTLPALAAADADRIRERLLGIRRRPGAASTSDASVMAQRFSGLVETTPAAAGPRTAADFSRTTTSPAPPDTNQRTASHDPATGVTA
jgi:3-methyladenine DNA glycosylase AlkD